MNPSCKELAERLARGEYERAPFLARLGLRLHLLHCRLCDKYARQLGLLGAALRGRKAGAADEDKLRRKLRERFK